MIHASYCTPEMMELDAAARENGVTILNEIGLDPGIDHFLAMRAIDEIHAESGSKVLYELHTDFRQDHESNVSEFSSIECNRLQLSYHIAVDFLNQDYRSAIPCGINFHGAQKLL